MQVFTPPSASNRFL